MVPITRPPILRILEHSRGDEAKAAACTKFWKPTQIDHAFREVPRSLIMRAELRIDVEERVPPHRPTRGDAQRLEGWVRNQLGFTGHGVAWGAFTIRLSIQVDVRGVLGGRCDRLVRDYSVSTLMFVFV